MRNPDERPIHTEETLSPFHYKKLKGRLVALTDEESIRKELNQVYGDSISKKIECLISLGGEGQDINILLKMLEFDLADKPPLYDEVSRTDYLEDDLCVATEELLNKLITRQAQINQDKI